MKKLGLLTFHTPINYGAVLQAVSLYKAIKSIEPNLELIDYRSKKFEYDYPIFTMRSCKTIKDTLWSILGIPNRIKQRKSFRKFVKRNCIISKPVYKNNIENYGAEYNAVIVGSDQVWNYHCTGNDSIYLLEWVSNTTKRYSYAASFGDSPITENNAEALKRNLVNFQSIALREHSGVDIVESLGFEGVQVLDPTLLLNMEEWNSIADGWSIDINNYILVYFMAQTPQITDEMMNLVKRIADEKQLEILVIGGSLHKTKNGIHYCNVSSPEEFINLFKNASCVVTNSFHGTAFSYIYRKTFYSYIKPEAYMSGRVSNFLRSIGLDERMFSHSSDIKSISSVDYDNSIVKFDRLKKESMDYIRKIANDSI